MNKKGLLLFLLSCSFLCCKKNTSDGIRMPQNQIKETTDFDVNTQVHQNRFHVNELTVEVIERGQLNTLLSYQVSGCVKQSGHNEYDMKKVYVVEDLRKNTDADGCDRFLNIRPVVNVMGKISSTDMGIDKDVHFTNELLLKNEDDGSLKIKIICGDKSQLIQLKK